MTCETDFVVQSRFVMRFAKSGFPKKSGFTKSDFGKAYSSCVFSGGQ